ncbi:hypothetical protein U3516DRAFT_733635 [Neocallimastix sp. 'constans']
MYNVINRISELLTLIIYWSNLIVSQLYSYYKRMQKEGRKDKSSDTTIITTYDHQMNRYLRYAKIVQRPRRINLLIIPLSGILQYSLMDGCITDAFSDDIDIDVFSDDVFSDDINTFSAFSSGKTQELGIKLISWIRIDKFTKLNL